MQLNPLHLKVAGLLGSRLFRIPDYQRAYAWGTRQRDDLFKDILEVSRSGREHFMATVVALARDARSIGADEYRTVELVDGQQRVTTIVLLLKAIEKALSSSNNPEAKVKRELAELLVKSDDHTVLLLQTNHDSSDIFPKYLRTGVIDRNSAVTAADMNLVNGMWECEAFVRTWSLDTDLVGLVGTVRNRLSMIYHELSDEATVYRVFEVLNSRGLDVKWIDKLKSQLMALIFEHVDNGSRAEAVRSMQNVWQDIYRKLGLRSDLGDEALRFSGTWALGSRPNKIVSEADASAGLVSAAGTKLKDIAAVGERLRAVVNAVHELDGNIRLRAVTRIIHARFVAIAILLRTFEPKVQAELLREWELVTFRIFGLGGADTRNKRGDYVKLGYEVLIRGITADEISTRLKALGGGFEITKLMKEPDWSESYSGWTEELRYLMFRYDEYLASEAGEKLNESQWNKIWAGDPSHSIEHIQPQSSELPYMHHLGNLCLLPPGVNSSLSDKAPALKASTYKACGLRATAEVGELIESGIKWDEKAVLARAKKIEAFIIKQWT